jgi:hypothetical protein
MDYNPRQQRQRGEPKKPLYHLSLPLHLALCWWQRAESYLKHFDSQFVFMWVAYGAANWQEKDYKVKQQANTSVAKQHTAKVIELVLIRLYSLRSQVIHGVATWNCNANRSQLNDGVNLLSQRVSIIVEVMMDNPQVLWGAANYPLLE